MAKLSRRVGSTSHILQVFVQDSSSSTGAGLAGLTNATVGLVAGYHRNTDATGTAISLVTMTEGTFTSSGFKVMTGTGIPSGCYQFCPPDAAFAAGASSVLLWLSGAANMAPVVLEVDLDAQVDVYLWNGTAVSAPATAGIPDVNAKNINNVAAATPGASGGMVINGANTGAVTLDALTITGSFAVLDGFLVSRTTPNTSAIVATGNGTGAGFAGLSGATSGAGMILNGIGTNAAGLLLIGSGANPGLQILAGGSAPGVSITSGNTAAGVVISGSIAGVAISGGNTGVGLSIAGGSTSGVGISVTTTSGHAVSLQPTNGHGILATANGNNKHGIVATGGTGGTSDGIKAVAGTGGVDIRGNITGNLTGAVSGAVGSVAAAVVVDGTSPLTEVYAGKGSAFTLASALYGLSQRDDNMSISSTTLTVFKRDGTTVAQTFTLDSATAPTSITQAT